MIDDDYKLLIGSVLNIILFNAKHDVLISTCFIGGLNNSSDCVCGKPQTVQHIINHCAVLGPLKEVGLAYTNEATSHWLEHVEGVT